MLAKRNLTIVMISALVIGDHDLCALLLVSSLFIRLSCSFETSYIGYLVHKKDTALSDLRAEPLAVSFADMRDIF